MAGVVTSARDSAASTNESRSAYALPVATSIYPDSGKVGAFPPDKLFRLADEVEYFDGEA